MSAHAQDASSPLSINPDQGKMGVYRALAQLAYQAYENKDNATAAVLARILEKSWDREQGELRKDAPEIWSKIDASMDGFIKPLRSFVRIGRADERKEEAAYQQCLANLEAAD